MTGLVEGIDGFGNSIGPVPPIPGGSRPGFTVGGLGTGEVVGGKAVVSNPEGSTADRLIPETYAYRLY
jgi:hypothetical protein